MVTEIGSKVTRLCWIIDYGEQAFDVLNIKVQPTRTLEKNTSQKENESQFSLWFVQMNTWGQ